MGGRENRCISTSSHPRVASTGPRAGTHVPWLRSRRLKGLGNASIAGPRVTGLRTVKQPAGRILTKHRKPDSVETSKCWVWKQEGPHLPQVYLFGSGTRTRARRGILPLIVYAVLDSGATHPMRQAKDEKEWEEAWCHH